jgi:hypothetical protein
MRQAVALPLFAVFFTASIAGQAGLTRSPTAADWAALAKLPDFGGVWEAGGGGGGGGGARGGGRGAARGAAPGRGRGGAPAGPQLTPAADARRKALQARPVEDSQTANCLPPGMPGIMGQPYPMEFLLTPGQVTIVIEAYQQVRHIYTDGRPLPDDPDPTFHGTSIGKWEGDTLVVESVGFSPLTQIANNIPHSGKMRIVERFRLADPDTMSIETTITDPDVLLAPLASSRTLRRHRDWTIAEYICEENNRNFLDESGKAGVDLSNPVGGPESR